MLVQPAQVGHYAVAVSMAFGPGLTVETALFTKITAHRATAPEAGPERTGTSQPATAVA